MRQDFSERKQNSPKGKIERRGREEWKRQEKNRKQRENERKVGYGAVWSWWLRVRRWWGGAVVDGKAKGEWPT